MGTLYQRGKQRIWWLKFYRGGKPYYESSRSTRKGDAQDLLKVREGKVVDGTFTGLRPYRVRYEELAADFLNDYRVNRKKTVKKAEQKQRVLGGFFGGRRAAEITTADVRAYIAKRQEEKAAPATINRELAALKRMFNLAIQAGKLHHRPHIPMLREDNVRTGFFGELEFLAVHEALPEDLKPVAAFAYTTGWRKEEILGLTWDRVSLQEGTVRLDPGTTKNDKGRTVVLTDELRATLAAQWERTRAFVLQLNPEATPRNVAAAVPWVFHRNGRRIGDLRGAWDEACTEGKVPGRLFHDLRRTAVRNMIRRGIPERVAMEISGHRTRSVFDRYNIVSEADLREAAQRMGGGVRVTESVTTPNQLHSIPPHSTT